MTTVVLAVPIRIVDDTIIYRHGRAWHAGEILEVTADDAARLVAAGAAERVRP